MLLYIIICDVIQYVWYILQDSLNRKFKRTAFVWNRIFCNIVNVFSVTFDQCRVPTGHGISGITWNFKRFIPDIESQGFFFLLSKSWNIRDFCLSTPFGSYSHRQLRLWHVREFCVFLAPEWANSYKSIKIPVLASNFVALTMINLYLIFTVEYMHSFDWTFFVLFKASSLPCLHTNCTAIIFTNAICV